MRIQRQKRSLIIVLTIGTNSCPRIVASESAGAIRMKDDYRGRLRASKGIAKALALI